MRHPLVLLPVLLATLVGAPPALAWTWPTDGPVLQPFVLGDDPYAAGQHRGIDVAGVAGTPVRAPAGGTVSFAGSVPGGGRTVTIQTADGNAVTLLHLGALGVVRGAVVEEGATVGTLGSSGDAEHAVAYVHLGVRVAADPQGYLDPLLLLPPRAPAAPEDVEATPAPVEVEVPASENEPVPPEGDGVTVPPAEAEARPGDVSGPAPSAPSAPSGVEVPGEPGVHVPAPAPAVVEAGGGSTAGHAQLDPEVRGRVQSAPASAKADATLPDEIDSPKGVPRVGKPEPAAVPSVPANARVTDGSGGLERARLGLAATALLGLAAAGALGLVRRRATSVPAPPAPEERCVELPAEVDAKPSFASIEPGALTGPRRRARLPGGPGRRLERLGPHGDIRPATVALGGARRERSRQADAW